MSILLIILSIKASLQQQIHFNSNIFGDKCCRCNEGPQYNIYLLMCLQSPVWVTSREDPDQTPHSVWSICLHRPAYSNSLVKIFTILNTILRYIKHIGYFFFSNFNSTAYAFKVSNMPVFGKSDTTSEKGPVLKWRVGRGKLFLLEIGPFKKGLHVQESK